MLTVTVITALLVCGGLWIGLWIWDRMQAPDDDYDNPDHWGEQ